MIKSKLALLYISKFLLVTRYLMFEGRLIGFPIAAVHLLTVIPYPKIIKFQFISTHVGYFRIGDRIVGTKFVVKFILKIHKLALGHLCAFARKYRVVDFSKGGFPFAVASKARIVAIL